MHIKYWRYIALAPGEIKLGNIGCPFLKWSRCTEISVDYIISNFVLGGILLFRLELPVPFCVSQGSGFFYYIVLPFSDILFQILNESIPALLAVSWIENPADFLFLPVVLARFLTCTFGYIIICIPMCIA